MGEQENLFPLQTVEPHLLDSPARSLLSIVRSWLRFISEWNIRLFKLEGGNDGWRYVGSVKVTQSSEIFYLPLILFILLFPLLPVLFIDPYSWKSFIVNFIALVSLVRRTAVSDIPLEHWKRSFSAMHIFKVLTLMAYWFTSVNHSNSIKCVYVCHLMRLPNAKVI